MQRQTRGFALLQRAGPMVDAYLATDHAREAHDYLEELRAAFAPHDPRAYRGVACTIDGIPPAPHDDEDAWLDAFHADRSDPLLQVRLAIGRLEDPGFDDDVSDLLPDLRSAREAAALAPEPGEVEIVQVRRHPFEPRPDSLGFDIGYWGGDHYSVLCDMIVTPTFHPPFPEDLGTVASHLRALNRRLLFPTEEAAAAFRARYLEFPWAETEDQPGEIEVIQLLAVDSASS